MDIHDEGPLSDQLEEIISLKLELLKSKSKCELYDNEHDENIYLKQQHKLFQQQLQDCHQEINALYVQNQSYKKNLQELGCILEVDEDIIQRSLGKININHLSRPEGYGKQDCKRGKDNMSMSSNEREQVSTPQWNQGQWNQGRSIETYSQVKTYQFLTKANRSSKPMKSHTNNYHSKQDERHHNWKSNSFHHNQPSDQIFLQKSDHFTSQRERQQLIFNLIIEKVVVLIRDQTKYQQQIQVINHKLESLELMKKEHDANSKLLETILHQKQNSISQIENNFNNSKEQHRKAKLEIIHLQEVLLEKQKQINHLKEEVLLKDEQLYKKEQNSHIKAVEKMKEKCDNFLKELEINQDQYLKNYLFNNGISSIESTSSNKNKKSKYDLIFNYNN